MRSQALLHTHAHVRAHAHVLTEDTCEESISQQKNDGLCSPEAVQT